ncbi:MAG: NADH:flavin oxidoreductase [Pseudomonadota bacterium]
MNETPAKDPLLQPFRLKHLVLKNRIMSTSHASGLEEHGLTGERYQRYHEEKAKGGIALSMFGGSSNVAPDSPNVFGQLDVGDDRCIPRFQEFAERMHRHGAALMIQITHLGRRAESYAGDWLPAIAPSPIRETLHRAFPREMDDNDIKRVVTAFGDAAWRCKQGCLDGLETLAGAHLIGQFLSPATNKRTDSFGGSLENRCRFGLMVYEEIRRRVGDDFIVGFRFVIDEAMRGGLDFEECLAIAHRFEASGTLDFFNAVYGRMDTVMGLARDNMPGMASPIAPWLDRAGAFKKAVTLPVFHAARIADIATARHAIAEGLLDMVAMTRAHIADPHLVAKLEAGEEARIRPCVGATHCMSPQRPVCLHNPATGRETVLPHEIDRAETTLTAVVAGGGPAGLEAARVLAERGHDVTLFEAAPRLGGQVLLAASASWRRDLIGVVDWRVSELARLGVEVRTGLLADADDIKTLAPDIVIVATGGEPDLAWLDGADHVLSSWDALTVSVPDGGTAIVYDGTGRHAAATVVERWAEAGVTVTLHAIDDAVTPEMAYAERTYWKKRLYELAIPFVPEDRLIRVEPSGNGFRATFENDITGTVSERVADRIIVEHGTVPVDPVFQALKPLSRNAGVTDLAAVKHGAPQPAGHDGDLALYRVGDCVASRNIAAAIYDAFRLCRTL